MDTRQYLAFKDRIQSIRSQEDLDRITAALKRLPEEDEDRWALGQEAVMTAGSRGIGPAAATT